MYYQIKIYRYFGDSLLYHRRPYELPNRLTGVVLVYMYRLTVDMFPRNRVQEWLRAPAAGPLCYSPVLSVRHVRQDFPDAGQAAPPCHGPHAGARLSLPRVL